MSYVSQLTEVQKRISTSLEYLTSLVRTVSHTPSLYPDWTDERLNDSFTSVIPHPDFPDRLLKITVKFESTPNHKD